jgi:hypothetical protein
MEKTIKRNIYIVLGLTVFLLIAMVAAWGTLLVKPQKAAIAQAQTDYQASKAIADRLPQAIADKTKAEDRRAYLRGQMAFFRQRYRSLYFGAINDPNPAVQKAARIVAWRRWQNEYFNDYGIVLRQELINVANATGVTINTAVKVTAPPRAPEEVAVPAYGLFKPTGGALSLTITGTLSDIMQFFNRINQSSILMLVDRNVRLEGYSPEIKATFSVTPYLLASGPGVALGTGTAGAAAPAAAPGVAGAEGTTSSAGAPDIDAPDIDGTGGAGPSP